METILDALTALLMLAILVEARCWPSQNALNVVIIKSISHFNNAITKTRKDV